MPARSAARTSGPSGRPAVPAVRPVPVPAVDAVAMAQAGLAFLANADMASVPAAAQAECLRGLERVESLATAARAGVLAAFMAGRGHEDDGQGSARAWLRWQTRVTTGAAAGAVAWARRLAAHPAVGGALAAGEHLGVVGAGDLRLDRPAPADKRPTRTRSCWRRRRAARIWRTWPGWPEEMQRRCAAPDADDDGGFGDRWLRLDLTLHGGGAGGG